MTVFIDPIDLSVALAACVFVGYMARDVWEDFK